MRDIWPCDESLIRRGVVDYYESSWYESELSKTYLLSMLETNVNFDLYTFNCVLKNDVFRYL